MPSQPNCLVTWRYNFCINVCRIVNFRFFKQGMTRKNHALAYG